MLGFLAALSVTLISDATSAQCSAGERRKEFNNHILCAGPHFHGTVFTYGIITENEADQPRIEIALSSIVSRYGFHATSVRDPQLLFIVGKTGFEAEKVKTVLNAKRVDAPRPVFDKYRSGISNFNPASPMFRPALCGGLISSAHPSQGFYEINLSGSTETHVQSCLENAVFALLDVSMPRQPARPFEKE